MSLMYVQLQKRSSAPLLGTLWEYEFFKISDKIPHYVGRLHSQKPH